MTKGIHLQEWKQALEHMKIAEQRLKEAECKARAHLWAYLRGNYHHTLPDNKVLRSVYDEVADAWYKRGTRKFWVSNFDCGSQEDVLAALRHMAANNVLKEQATVICDGNVVWRGPSKDVNNSLLRMIWLNYAGPCDDSDEPISFEDALEYGVMETTYEFEIPLKLNTVNDLAGSFLYYDRKEDPDLPVNDIEAAVVGGEITKDEIVEAFSNALGHLAPLPCAKYVSGTPEAHYQLTCALAQGHDGPCHAHIYNNNVCSCGEHPPPTERRVYTARVVGEIRCPECGEKVGPDNDSPDGTRCSECYERDVGGEDDGE